MKKTSTLKKTIKVAIICLVVFANINGSRYMQTAKLPDKLSSPYYTMSTSLQPKIIKYSLDNYVSEYILNAIKKDPKVGPHRYIADVYEKLGL